MVQHTSFIPWNKITTFEKEATIWKPGMKLENTMMIFGSLVANADETEPLYFYDRRTHISYIGMQRASIAKGVTQWAKEQPQEPLQISVFVGGTESWFGIVGMIQHEADFSVHIDYPW